MTKEISLTAQLGDEAECFIPLAVICDKQPFSSSYLKNTFLVVPLLIFWM